MLFQKCLWFLLATLALSECAYVDTLKKCHLKDEGCQKNLLQSFLKDTSKTGVAELNIPPLDPIAISNLNISILNVIDLKIIEGEAKGVKNCIVNKFIVDLEKSRSLTDFTCDLVLKAKYYVHSDSPVIKNLLGGGIHGEGNGKAKIEKLNLKIEHPVHVKKRGDDYFLFCDYKKMKYSFDIIGKIVLAADQLYLGNKESSKEVVALFNENWKPLVGSFGNHFVEVALKLVFDMLKRFFDHVPTKHYITDDVSQYV